MNVNLARADLSIWQTVIRREEWRVINYYWLRRQQHERHRVRVISSVSTEGYPGDTSILYHYHKHHVNFGIDKQLGRLTGKHGLSSTSPMEHIVAVQSALLPNPVNYIRLDYTLHASCDTPYIPIAFLSPIRHRAGKYIFYHAGAPHYFWNRFDIGTLDC